MARRRRIRGSRGPFYILIMLVVFGTAAIFAGKFIQDFFLENVKSEFGLKQQPSKIPPNPATQPLQMN